MKNGLFFLFWACVVTSAAYAQPIEAVKAFGGYKFIQNDKLLTMKDMLLIMEPQPQAYALMKKAQSGNGASAVIGFVGGALIGWPLGTALGGGDPNWALAAVGVGIVAIGIPISSSATKKALQAVDLYNTSLGATSYRPYQPRLRCIVGGNQVGLSLHF